MFTFVHNQEQTTPDPDAWRCPQPWGYFPDPESCCYFYQCEEDVAYHEICPTGTQMKTEYSAVQIKQVQGCVSAVLVSPTFEHVF